MVPTTYLYINLMNSKHTVDLFSVFLHWPCLNIFTVKLKHDRQLQHKFWLNSFVFLFNLPPVAKCRPRFKVVFGLSNLKLELSIELPLKNKSLASEFTNWQVTRLYYFCLQSSCPPMMMHMARSNSIFND